MVRQTKQTPEEKKELHRKKSASIENRPTKASESGVWPCQINGCNKLFAREADLKRHQRTTKLHSMPGFACPQCDATFTRTDALRRHQKSRHNGIIIEPASCEKKGRGEGNPQPSALKSRSRSTSPPSDGEKNPCIHAATSTPPSSVPSSGPQHYYRQHTLPGVLMPPNMQGDAPYPPNIGPPTSAARLHHSTLPPSQSPWVYPPHLTACYPSPYYRPGMISPPHPELAAQLPNSQYRHAPHNATSPHAVESSSSHRGTPPITPPCAETAKDSTPTNMAPVIDPSLDTACLTSTNEKESSLLISPSHGDIPVTSAASSELRSVSTEEARAGRCQASGGTLETAPPSQSPKDPLDEIVEDSERKTEEATSNTEVVDGAGINPRYPPAPVSNPRGMEQILTEDGEPMLNPAELLTQESLASPPP